MTIVARLSLTAVLTTAALLSVLLVEGRWREGERPAPRRAAAEAVASASSRPARAGTEGVVGVLVAKHAVTLTAMSPGRVEALLVRPGDRVRSGDVVATLDSRAMKRELAIADASRLSAEAEVGRAALELDQARDTLARRKALSAQGLTPGEDLARASFDEKLAASRLDIARAKALEAGARVAQIRGALRDAELRAPLSGVVAARFVDPGATVQPATPVLRLISDGELCLRFAVPAALAAELGPGRVVRAEVGRAGVSVLGTIETISPEVDGAARLVLVEAQIRAEDAPRVRALTGEAARVDLGLWAN